jgi:hypothetical protein
MDPYNDVAEVYASTYGEPLVADWNWIEPLFNACEMAVAVGADLTHDEFVGGAKHDEVLKRTAAVIATITHGVEGAQTARMQTAGRKAIEATS